MHAWKDRQRQGVRRLTSRPVVNGWVPVAACKHLLRLSKMAVPMGPPGVPMENACFMLAALLRAMHRVAA